MRPSLRASLESAALGQEIGEAWPRCRSSRTRLRDAADAVGPRLARGRGAPGGGFRRSESIPTPPTGPELQRLAREPCSERSTGLGCTLLRLRLRVGIERCGPPVPARLPGPPSRRSSPPPPSSPCVAAARLTVDLPTRRRAESTRARRRPPHPRAGADPAADRRAVGMAEAETARPRPVAETVRP